MLDGIILNRLIYSYIISKHDEAHILSLLSASTFLIDRQ